MEKEGFICFPNNLIFNNIESRKKPGIVETTGSIITMLFLGTTPLANDCQPVLKNDYDSAAVTCVYQMETDYSQSTHQNYPTFDLTELDNIEIVNKMSTFDDDWNGTGGVAFSKESIALFKKTLHELNKQPEIAPTGRDSLYMQYKLNDNSLLAFELSKRRMEIVYIPKGVFSMAETSVVNNSFSTYINEKVNRLYGFNNDTR